MRFPATIPFPRRFPRRFPPPSDAVAWLWSPSGSPALRSLPLLAWKCPSPLQVDTIKSCPQKPECPLITPLSRRSLPDAYKLINSASGTTLVICGYLHYESLVRKLREKGHTVDRRVYLGVCRE